MQLKRVRLIVPLLAFGLSSIAALAPALSSADSAVSISIHEGGDPTSWGYTPTTTTVSAGQTVTWTNSGAFPHDAAATDGSWKTPLLDPGASASVTFSTPGTYAYICTPHPWMQATIVVTDVAPDAAPTTAVPAPTDSPTPTSGDTN